MVKEQNINELYKAFYNLTKTITMAQQEKQKVIALIEKIESDKVVVPKNNVDNKKELVKNTKD